MDVFDLSSIANCAPPTSSVPQLDSDAADTFLKKMTLIFGGSSLNTLNATKSTRLQDISVVIQMGCHPT